MSEHTEGNLHLQPNSAAPHIGAFVLETLTLGMYGEPRHTLREYVQNSFDAIRAAQRTKFLQGRGVVRVTLAQDLITIKDNGLGVPSAQAWNTLTSNSRDARSTLTRPPSIRNGLSSARIRLRTWSPIRI